ncbi:MAG TPA: metallophosphoesterase [Saprospiraceae bacterium]|nr:metallophosphoesterase [Saprospiraceae bacterium]HMQ81652.1 metallophosphoesterase [Saprospiraceae bacterium]
MMKKQLFYAISIGLLAFSLSSCASYQLRYGKTGKNWEQELATPETPLVNRVFLVGDAGYTPNDTTSPALVLLQKKLAETTAPAAVVFLGDNLYPNGMAPSDSPERERDEYRIKAQLDVVKDFEDLKVFFVPGNHDWYDHGLDGIKREKKFIENYLDRKDVWLPKPGCGDPVEVKISDQLVLILIDSQWYLTDWDDEPEINNGCEIQSRDVFIRYMEEAIKSNRHKNILIALHHPPYTNGPHGGRFTLKEHIFPFTSVNKKLWIPLPIVGTMMQFIRGTVGHNQDVSHPRYREMTSSIISAAQKNGNFVLASGHEHTLQYFEKDGQSFVVSGSGSKRSPLGGGNEMIFGYGQYGFAYIDYHADGSAWLSYWSAEADAPDGRLVYKKKISEPLKDLQAVAQDSFPPFPEETSAPITKETFNNSFLWRFFWGKHYRDSYEVTVNVPAIDLEEHKGGLTPLKRGGGYQTNSLRLGTEEGKEYVIRSIDKDASRTLSYPFNQSIASDLLRDNFSASHPLSALPVSVLAKAAGVYHTNPELVYLPRQPALGIFNEEFGDGLYVMEERPDDDHWGEAEQFGNSDNIVSTSDVLEEIFNEHDEQVDYPWVVRSRLFDVLIGDWDRHDDQWRWAEIDQEATDFYRPIPRDRDQAFSKYDGLVLGLGRQTAPNIKKLMVFKGDLKKVKWLTYNGRHFDRTFLSGASWETWEAEAQQIQQSLDDATIERAFTSTWPESIYALDGAAIAAKLINRRNDLLRIARQYYLQTAAEVDVIGTNKKDLFAVERLENGATRVAVYDANKAGEKQEKIYDRTFLPDETRQIVLYGLDGDDFFEISGQAKKAILVRIVAGLGEDTYTDQSDIKNGGKSLVFYDPLSEKRHLEMGKETKLFLNDNPFYNTLYRRSLDYEFDYGMLLPSAAYNLDDGFLLGISGQYTTYGFKKAPYASHHQYYGQYALATSGFLLGYKGEFIDVFGKWELTLDAQAQGPLYAINYYGDGNETLDPTQSVGDADDADLDFNRVRQRLVSFAPAITRRMNEQSEFSIGPTFESIRIDRTEGRYIDQIGDRFDPELFDGLEFLGLRTIFDYRNTDSPAIPTRGVGLYTELGWKQQLDDTEKSFPYLNAALTAYQQLDASASLVFATRIGVEHRFSDGYEFFQAATLGGPGPNANFRGFRRNRFTGKTAFYQNIDLRWRILNSGNKVVPFSLGLLAGFDHGRVWIEEEESELWHYSYGGGLWISPFDLLVIKASLFFPDGEAGRLLFGGAFFF